MNWAENQPCTVCGAETTLELHTLPYSKRSYHAPLYHIEQYAVGFCGPVCSNAWMRNYKRMQQKA
jgi:hypothetical protein